MLRRTVFAIILIGLLSGYSYASKDMHTAFGQSNFQNSPQVLYQTVRNPLQVPQTAPIAIQPAANNTASQNQVPAEESSNGLSVRENIAVALGAASLETAATFPLRGLKVDMQTGGTFSFTTAGLSRVGKRLSRGFPATFATSMMRQPVLLGLGLILPHATLIESLASAVVAGTVSGLSGTPGGLFLAQQRTGNATSREIFRRTYRQRGFTGFFQGGVPIVVKAVGTSLGFFVLPGALEEIMPESLKDTSAPLIASGFLTAAAFAPVDMAKSNIQKKVLTRGQKAPGMVTTMRKIVREKGYKHLWTGARLRMTNQVIGFVVAGAVIDKLTDYFGGSTSSEAPQVAPEQPQPPPQYQPMFVAHETAKGQISTTYQASKAPKQIRSAFVQGYLQQRQQRQQRL